MSKRSFVSQVWMITVVHIHVHLRAPNDAREAKDMSDVMDIRSESGATRALSCWRAETGEVATASRALATKLPGLLRLRGGVLTLACVLPATDEALLWVWFMRSEEREARLEAAAASCTAVLVPAAWWGYFSKNRSNPVEYTPPRPRVSRHGDERSSNHYIITTRQQQQQQQSGTHLP